MKIIYFFLSLLIIILFPLSLNGNPIPITYIEGYINDSQGTPLAGVTVTSGDSLSNYVTNTTGFYIFYIPGLNQDFLVTPTKSGWEFIPPSRTYINLLTPQTNQNFIGLYKTTAANEVIIKGGEKGYINTHKGEKALIILNPSSSGQIKIKIYDLLGILVWETTKEVAGSNQEIIEWNGRNTNGEILAAGIYIIQIYGGGINKIKKVALIK